MHRPGFTLIEATVSAALVGVLALGMGSAVLVTARAIPTTNVAANLRTTGNTALSQLCGELRYMTALRDQGATYIEFAVADRDASGADEIIRYDWSTGSLTRSYNGGAAVTMLGRLNSLTLGLNKAVTTSTVYSTGMTSSGEVLMSKFSGWPLVLLPTSVNSNLTSTAWAESSFTIDQVSIPANATRLELTKLRLRLRKASTPTGATISAGIYQSQTKKAFPDASFALVGPAAVVSVASLPSIMSYVDIPLSGVLPDPTLSSYNFVVKGSGTSSAIINSYTSILASGNGSIFLTSANSGASWAPSTGQQQNDVLYEVYGTYSWPTASAAPVDTWRLHTVSLSLSMGTPAIVTETTVGLVNEPVVAGP